MFFRKSVNKETKTKSQRLNRYIYIVENLNIFKTTKIFFVFPCSLLISLIGGGIYQEAELGEAETRNCLNFQIISDETDKVQDQSG